MWEQKRKYTHVRPSLTEWINKRILNINKTLRIIKLAANIDAQAHYKPNGDSIHEIQTNKIDRLKIIKIICVPCWNGAQIDMNKTPNYGHEHH